MLYSYSVAPVQARHLGEYRLFSAGMGYVHSRCVYFDDIEALDDVSKVGPPGHFKLDFHVFVTAKNFYSVHRV